MPIFLAILAVILPFAGWLTHIVICFKSASWVLLLAGAIFFPIGIIHGWGSWFGFW
jgi:uncharacterized membrane protein